MRKSCLTCNGYSGNLNFYRTEPCMSCCRQSMYEPKIDKHCGTCRYFDDPVREHCADCLQDERENHYSGWTPKIVDKLDTNDALDTALAAPLRECRGITRSGSLSEVEEMILNIFEYDPVEALRYFPLQEDRLNA